MGGSVRSCEVKQAGFSFSKECPTPLTRPLGGTTPDIHPEYHMIRIALAFLVGYSTFAFVVPSYAQNSTSGGSIGGAKLVSINQTEVVVFFRNEERKYQLTPATKIQVFGKGKIADLRTGTRITLKAKTSPTGGEITDWHLLFDPDGSWSGATSSSFKAADGSLKDWELNLRCVLRSISPLQLLVLPGNSFSIIDTDGKLYSTKQIDMTGKLLTLKPELAAKRSGLGDGALDADTFEINLGKNPQLIGTDPLVGVLADKSNPSTAGALRFTRTEPVELPASISQKNDKKKSK